MALRPVDAEAGLWADPEVLGGPATYAVIVGVSQYPHLAADKDGISEPYGLGHLFVSALTAYRFFEWMRDDYYYEGAPLGWCRVLLSPTAAEAELIGDAGSHAGEATFDQCEQAIGDWVGALADLRGDTASRSRAIFFFSGHGLELTQEKQVLLPADYLDPYPMPRFNRAISSLNLVHGMRSLGIRDQLFFVDACRGVPKELSSLGVEIDGAPILTVRTTEHNNPDVIGAVTYASASGSFAWQPADCADGLSFFGDALIEGLKSVPPEEGVSPPGIWHPDLYRFVDKRLKERLKTFDARASQPLPPAMYNIYVVHRPPGATDLAPEIGPRDKWVQPDLWEAAPVATNPTDLTAWLGNDARAAVWASMEIAGVDSLRTYDVQIIEVRSLGPDHQRITIRIDTALEPTMLRFQDPARVHAAVIPPDERSENAIDIELAWGIDDELTGLRASISAHLASWPSARRTAEIWQRYRDLDPQGYGDQLADDELDAVRFSLYEKQKSPFTAALAAIVLLRANRVDRIPFQWMRNLATWFPWLPDGMALLATYLDRVGPEPPLDPVSALRELAAKPTVPFTTDAFGYALALAEVYSHAPEVRDEDRDRISSLWMQLNRLAPLVRTGGMLVGLEGDAQIIHPHLVRLQGIPEYAFA